MTYFSLHILSIPITNSALGLCCSSVRAGINLNVSQCGCNLAADPLIRQALQSPAAGHSSHFTGCSYSPGWFYWERWLGSCQRPLSLAYTHTQTHTHWNTLQLPVKVWACPGLNLKILSELVNQRLCGLMQRWAKSRFKKLRVNYEYSWLKLSPSTLQIRSVHTERYTQYLKAAPVYGVHWCGLGSDHSDINTAALQSRPQLNYQCSYKTCKNNNELTVST